MTTLLLTVVSSFSSYRIKEFFSDTIAQHIQHNGLTPSRREENHSEVVCGQHVADKDIDRQWRSPIEMVDATLGNISDDPNGLWEDECHQ